MSAPSSADPEMSFKAATPAAQWLIKRNILGKGKNEPGLRGEKMDIRTLLRNFHLEKIRLGPRWAKVEINFKDDDQNAAWELYVEMLTRIVTQPLPSEVGDEKTALDSVYSLFPTTREVLRHRGRQTIQFSKVAIPVLNQVVRPFTAKWHGESLRGAFDDPAKRKEFREELEALQKDLGNYNRMLAKIAGVEDLTDFEKEREEG